MFQTEEELVERLVHYYQKYFIVKELGVGYGISDLVIVRNRADLLRFLEDRKGVHLKHIDEIKVFEYIRKRNGVDLDELVSKHFISRSKMKYSIIKNLEDVGAIKRGDSKYYRTPSFKLFSPMVTAIEAKLEDWNKGLAQAIRYQRFANKTYLAMDEKYVHRADKSEFSRYNVGLLSVGAEIKELVKPSIQKPTDSFMRYKVSEEIIFKNEEAKIEKHNLT
ncbi:hypothetical protein [Brevibacillus daliensis]|uniref:hypothetical protein n=1 Tax=Brevibacillus daliensis TaxID=2892995 RepID=UPI001E4E099B|nr:hypothetical protein [Brevibacillus daliensis]